MHAFRFSCLLALLGSLTACNDAAPPDDVSDAAVDAPIGLCQRDDQCDDGVYCNGREICAPNSSTNPDGCRTEQLPCTEGRRCLETEQRCVTECATERDSDGDGFDAAECGGPDCDDGAPGSSPAGVEGCDAEGHDEDCDPDTLGGRDMDVDGFVDVRCCNVQSTGSQRCGGDCNDADPAIRPGVAELCDAADVDENCDGSIDAPGGCDCTGSGSRACSGAEGECAGGTQTCIAGTWSGCSIGPRSELCDGRDEDCDGSVDETLTITCWPDADVDGYAVMGATTVQRCPDPGRSTAPFLRCDVGYTGTAPGTFATSDCDDTTPTSVLPTRCAIDADHDLHGDRSVPAADSAFVCPGTPCPATLAIADDCCDTEAEAFPGQTEYFPTARAGCGGYDYDCDGSEATGRPVNVNVRAICEARPDDASCIGAIAGGGAYAVDVACGANGYFYMSCYWEPGEQCGGSGLGLRQTCR